MNEIVVCCADRCMATTEYRAYLVLTTAGAFVNVDTVKRR